MSRRSSSLRTSIAAPDGGSSTGGGVGTEVGDPEDGSRWVFGGIAGAWRVRGGGGARERGLGLQCKRGAVEERRQQELFLLGSDFGNEKRPLICQESPMGELLLSFEMTGG
jgi:hypothetical protein